MPCAGRVGVGVGAHLLRVVVVGIEEGEVAAQEEVREGDKGRAMLWSHAQRLL
jgi:hypothetical protein